MSDEGNILLREGTDAEIDVSIESIKQFLMYVAQNRGLIPRQIAWEMNVSQNIIHAILESIEEAHEFVLKGYIAISDHARTPQWFLDLKPNQRARVPKWDGQYPSYFGPLPQAIRDRTELHPVFLKEADAIFRRGFRTLGATPRIAKAAVAKDIVGLVGRMTTAAGQATGTKVRSFDEFSKVWNEKNKAEAEPPVDLEHAATDDEDDETISLDYMVGFSTTHIRQRVRETPPVPPAAPVAATAAPAPLAHVAPVAPLAHVAPVAPKAPVAPVAPKAAPAPTASLFPTAPVSTRINTSATRGINQKGAAPSYTDAARAGRIALMTYLEPDMHARLKAWAVFSESTLTRIAADAISEYVERNGIPKLDEY